MKTTRVSFVALCVAATGALAIGVHDTYAASSTGFASATVQASGSVGVVTPPAVEVSTSTTTTTTTPAIPATTQSASSGRIPSPPTDPTRQSGFGDAPPPTVVNTGAGSGATAEETAVAASAAKATARRQTSSVTPRFPSAGATPISLGGASSIAISGAPNQAYSLSLPASATFQTGGQVVSITNLQHSGGTTPAIGDGGAAVVSIGGTVATSGSGQTTGGSNDGAIVLASAFTSQPPIVAVLLTYD